MDSDTSSDDEVVPSNRTTSWTYGGVTYSNPQPDFSGSQYTSRSAGRSVQPVAQRTRGTAPSDLTSSQYSGNSVGRNVRPVALWTGATVPGGLHWVREDAWDPRPRAWHSTETEGRWVEVRGGPAEFLTLDEYVVQCYDNAVGTNTTPPLSLHLEYQRLSFTHWGELRIHWSELPRHEPTSYPGKQKYLDTASAPGYNLDTARDIWDVHH